MKFPKPNLHLLVLGLAALIFFVVGERRAFRLSHDFVPVYTGAACLLHGCNPYDTVQLEQQFFQRGGRAIDLPSWEIDVPVYPPSTFLVLTPLTVLRYPLARLVWFMLNCCLFIISAVLVLYACPPRHRWLATILGSLILATSGILLVVGQPATLAISLVIISSCLLLGAQWMPLGAFLLMLSLAVKPQIGGLVALYFLAQKAYWRYAAVTLAGALMLFLSASLVLRLHPKSAGWTSTLRANLAATLSPGGSADPRQANQEAIGDTNLQALTSIFFKDAEKFNLVAYGIFLGLLAVWIIVVPRSNASLDIHFLALAALSILSLMPIYHRFYDTRLLLLTVPAVVIVYRKRRLLGTVIAVLTALAVISVQYRVQVFLVQHAEWQNILRHKFLFILILRQQNLELLILFGLYLVAILGIRFSSASAIEPYSVHRSTAPFNR
jgi:Glycosyltransferase family 87